MAITALPAPLPASNENLCLPAGYRRRPAGFTHDATRAGEPYWAPWRLAENARWQRHVYQWAAELVRSRGLRSVLDVGCGPCVKLMKLVVPRCADVVGLDQPSGLAAARALGARFPLHEVDLERPEVELGRTFDLILCADVIEHLVNPDALPPLFRVAAHPGTLLLISTPERTRERGRGCMESAKPEHACEWSREEFRRYLCSRGLVPLRHRLLPKDDAERGPLREAERDFRLGRRSTSPLCCQAWLCRIEGCMPSRAGC